MSVAKIIMYKSPGRPWGMPDLSPFCVKLETYLRMAGWDEITQIREEVSFTKGRIIVRGKLVVPSRTFALTSAVCHCSSRGQRCAR